MKKKMLKIEFLVRSDDKELSTKTLQDLGLFHLIGSESQAKEPSFEAWKEAQALVEWLETREVKQGEHFQPFTSESWLETGLSLKAEYQSLNYSLSKLKEELDFYRRWPDYDKSHWDALATIDLHLALYELEELKNVPSPYYQLPSYNGLKRAAHIYRGSKLNSFVDPLAIPSSSKEDLESQIKRIDEELKTLEAKIDYLTSQKDLLQQEINDTLDQWQWQQGMDLWWLADNQKITALKAWYAEENQEIVEEFANSMACAYRIKEPEKGEAIPVVLENGRFSKLFEPITKIFQLPAYHEFDLTPLIAVFYPILFAYCLGDAGYGLLMTVAALIGLFTFLKSQKGIAYLVLILGLSTTVMGLIKSGSLFGVAIVADHQIGWIASLAALIIVPDDSSYFFNAFNVALLIGVVQIIIGMIIAIVKNWYYLDFKHALSHWGKLFIVIASIALFMSETLNLEATGQSLFKALLAFGVLLVMFFHDLNLGLINRIGGSILPLFFIFTGLLGDVLSYVRLFALGVTSAVLGLVVNQIGMNMMGDSWLSIIGASLFLLFGHSLNLVLAVLGSFIHPLRLTFVEFYNNAQFEGGGIEFKAFQKSKQLNIQGHGNS